jgi:hypothetical protein
MWAGGGFGMVLNGKEGIFFVSEPFDGVIIKVYMGYLNVASQGIGVHGESVILGGNFDFTRKEVLHRLICTSMPKL